MHVVGARPNFMKLAPVFRALRGRKNVEQFVVHTGQHYDVSMSDVFFTELGIPAPNVNLQVGSGTHASQTANIIKRFEPVLLDYGPDLVLVYGDVNSTVAAALVCSKLGVRVAHVEAGLRSFDRTMPEEVNRVLTDQISDLLFTPSQDGNTNLEREGVAPRKIHLVGNVMIDTLVRLLPLAQQRLHKDLSKPFVLVTLHRPANVDDPQWLTDAITALRRISEGIDVIFPVHPRTRTRLPDLRLGGCENNGIHFMEPLAYLDFLGLLSKSTAVITDSGGIQEESTFLGIPCLTMRDNTERPVTVEKGTNQLIGRDWSRCIRALREALNRTTKKYSVPPLWDGHAAERIADVIENYSPMKNP